MGKQKCSAILNCILRMGLVTWMMMSTYMVVLPPIIALYVIGICMAQGSSAKHCDVSVNNQVLSKKERKRCCKKAYFWTVVIISNAMWVIYAAYSDVIH